MTNSLQPSGDRYVAERRMHHRQNLASSRVELGDTNEGVVLNISQTGLALWTTHELLDDELPRMRFQFAESEAWIEAKGRIKWRSDTNKTAGVEFVDLPAATRKQIEILIFLSYEPDFPSKNRALDEIKPGDESTAPEPSSAVAFREEFEAWSRALTIPMVEQLGEPAKVPEMAISEVRVSETEIAHAQVPTPESESAPATEEIESDGEAIHQEENQPPAEVQFPPKRKTVGTVTSAQPNGVTSGSRNTGRLFVLCLAAALVLLAFVPIRHYLQKSGIGDKDKVATEANLPVPSAEVPASDVAPFPERATESAGAIGHSPVHTALGLQVGAMIRQENANALARSLRQSNFSAAVVKAPGDRYFRVVVGPYNSVDAALRARKELEKRGLKALRVRWKPRAA
jgi:septal ring-binding cell division protein DamX